MKKEPATAIAVVAAIALIGTAALAADMAVKMPVKAPPPAPIPVFSWTGCYIGAQAGYASGNTGYDLNIPPTPGSGFDIGLGGDVAGGHVGCNYQVSYFVIGVEGDGEWIGLRGNDGGKGGTIDQINGNWQTSIRGRLGIAFDRILFYGTGGGAWMNVTYSRPNFDSLTIDNTLSGWTAGAGVEYAFWNNLSARVEYRYARFGSEAFPFTTGTQRTLRDTTTNTWRFGLTYKFFGGDMWGKGPVAVK